MRIGVNTLLWTAAFDEGHFPLLPKIAAAGFDGVEVTRFTFDGFNAAAVRRALADHGLACTMCTALTGSQSIITNDAAQRASTIDFLRRAIDCAAALGAEVLAGPFCAPVGFLPGRRRDAGEWGRAVDGLQQLGPALDAAGVDLAVEPLNRFETFFLNTCADSAALCGEVGHSRIGVLFDTFHANIEEKSSPEAVRELGGWLKHFHASENDRGTPGSGQVRWTETSAALRESGYADWVVIESFGSNISEIAAAASIWRDLAATPSDIAWDGVKFLRRLFA